MKLRESCRWTTYRRQFFVILRPVSSQDAERHMVYFCIV